MAMRVTIDTSGLQAMIAEKLNPDDKLRLYAHQRLAAYCELYVPMETGMLAQTVNITKDGVEYAVPYAHYLYEGEIYGPNIPIKDEGGMIVGYFSPPGQAKKPTGRSLTYSKELHPLATDHWDQAAMAARKDDLLDDIANYITTDGGKNR